MLRYAPNDFSNIFKDTLSHSWCIQDVPELAVPIITSTIEGCCKQWSYWTKESTVSITLRNICVTNDDGFFPFVVITIRPSPYYWLIIGFLTRVTRRVPLVGQEGLCCSIFRFLCSALYIIVCPFYLFLSV
jgi:hypothetical protein